MSKEVIVFMSDLRVVWSLTNNRLMSSSYCQTPSKSIEEAEDRNWRWSRCWYSMEAYHRQRCAATLIESILNDAIECEQSLWFCLQLTCVVQIQRYPGIQSR